MTTGLEFVNSLSLPDAANWYVRNEFVITPCRPKSKKAYLMGWNKDLRSAGWISTLYKAEHWNFNPNDNIGMILGPSKFITLDLDNLSKAREVFNTIGMEGVLTTPTAGIRSGRANSGKLVFLAPEGCELEHHALTATIDGVNATIFELRAGMIQDVLPPSIHPEGGRYQWVGPEPILIRPAPTDLIDIWQHWQEWEPVLKAIAEGRDAPAAEADTPQDAHPHSRQHTGRRKSANYTHTAADVCEEWNRRHTLTAELMAYGYRPAKCGDPRRFDRPDCNESDGGVVILGPDKFYVHNTSDEFCDGKPHDCFDLYLRYEHNGDRAAALRAAEQELGWGAAVRVPAAGGAETIRPAPTPDDEEHTPTDKIRSGTIDAYAEQIAQRWNEYVTLIPLTDKKGDQVTDGNGKAMISIKVNADKYARIWQEVSHLCGVMEGKDSYAYFDGAKFETVSQSEGIAKGVNRCAHRTAELITAEFTTEDIKKPIKQLRGTLDMLRDITAHRPGHTTVSLQADTYRAGLLLRDGRVIIHPDGTIEIRRIDPAVDFWLSSCPTSTADILDGIGDMTLRDVLNEFPAFRQSVQACAPPEERTEEPCPHERWIVSVCGVLVYYTQSHHKPLDIWPYAWDHGQGGSGKTTHLSKIAEAFGNYVLNGVSWSVFTGQQMFNGSWIGRVGIICQEAGVHMVEDTEAIKCRTSGGWALREMHMSEITISQPLCMISAGNTKPLLKQAANGRPIWQRILPIEWAQELRTGDEMFPCSDDEYYRAVLNIGLWQAIQLMRDSGRRKKRALSYTVTEDEVRDLLQYAPYEDIIAEHCKVDPTGRDVAVSELYELILREMQDRGVENPRAIPSLRTEKAFRDDIVRQAIPNNFIDLNGISRQLGKAHVRIVRPSSEKTYWVVGLAWRDPAEHAKYPTTRK